MTYTKQKRVHKIRLLSIAVMVIIWPVFLLAAPLLCTLFLRLVEEV